MDQRQDMISPSRRHDLTSPHITRTTSSASNSTMEVVTESCHRFNEQQSDVNNKRQQKNSGWGPPIVQRKQRAWEDTERTDDTTKTEIRPTRTSARDLQHKTQQWVSDQSVSTTYTHKKIEKIHPMSVETQSFLEGMVCNMRDTVQFSSNTGVMCLLDKPVSVFDDPEVGQKDVNLEEQDAINKELEEFLKQIKEIRDGPADQQLAVQGDVAQELTAHMSEQQKQVKEALTVLERELTQGSVPSRVNTPQEEEYKKLVMERTMVQSAEQRAEPPCTPPSRSVTVTSVNSLSSVSQSENKEEKEKEEKTEDNEEAKPEYVHIPKRMGLYELLDLHPDPKVRKAALKMKRLDEQLRLVIRKEKEVKKQHDLLNKQLLLYTTGAELINTNMDSEQQDNGDDITVVSELHTEGEVTPIFPTQIHDEDFQSEVELPPLSPTGCSVTVSNSTAPGSTRKHPSSHRHTARSQNPGSSGKSRNTARNKASSTSFSKREDKKKQNNKNFIARNKELAQNASSTIAMTDAEKQRLEELLCDIDDIDENKLAKDVNNTVAVLCGDGFRATAEEENRLTEINNALVIEEGSAMSVCSKSTENTIFSVQSKLISELDEKCPLETDKKLGEGALKTLTKNRSEQERIQMIDDMLSKFNNDEETPEVPRSALDELLSQCRSETAMSAKPATDPDQESLLSVL